MIAFTKFPIREAHRRSNKIGRPRAIFTALTLAFVAVPVVVQTPTARAAAPIIVNTLADTSAPCGAVSCNLRGAIDKANTDPGPDVIQFSVDGTIVLDASLGFPYPGLPFVSDTTITGINHNITIDGNNQSRIFIASNSTFEYLTLKNGFGTGPGGSGAALAVNSASDLPAFPGGGTVNVRHCTFTGNHSRENSRAHGGAIYNNAGNLNVTDSTFTGNYSYSGAGAIYSLRGTLTVDSSVFDSNFSHIVSSFGKPLPGGAIGGDGTVTISRTLFNNNSAVAGGAIGLSGTLTVETSTFTNNNALGINGADVNPIELIGGFRGGGAIATSGPATVVNSTFVANSATDGGAISNIVGLLTVSSSTFSDNVATLGTGYGGAIFTSVNTSPIVTALKNSLFQRSVLAGTQIGNCSLPGVGGIGGFQISDGGGNVSDDASCGFLLPSSLSNTIPKLSALANNGGPTQTMALLADSPALRRAVGTCPATDQRGAVRRTLGCDSGAYEIRTPNAKPAYAGADVLSSTSLRVRWTDNASDETGYFVYRYANGVSTPVPGCPTTTPNITSCVDTGLAPDTMYLYYVYAWIAGGGYTTPPSFLVARTPANTPTPPSLVSAVATGPTSARVSWIDNSTNETGFKVYRYNGSAYVAQTTVGPNITEAAITDPTMNTGTYQVFLVTALHPTGEIYADTYIYSNALTGTAGTLSSPTNIKAAAVSGTTATITWADNATNETGYVIYRSTATNTTMVNCPTTTPNLQTCTDSGLTPGTFYSYTVYPWASGAYGYNGTTLTVHTPRPLPAATVTDAYGTPTPGDITLHWVDNATDEQGYRIRAYAPNGTYNTYAVPPNTTSYTVHSQNPATQPVFVIETYRGTDSVFSQYIWAQPTGVTTTLGAISGTSAWCVSTYGAGWTPARIGPDWAHALACVNPGPPPNYTYTTWVPTATQPLDLDAVCAQLYGAGALAYLPWERFNDPFASDYYACVR
jgi:hypothetical protein